eukprot:746387-Hanusia_phi.AAC.2
MGPPLATPPFLPGGGYATPFKSLVDPPFARAAAAGRNGGRDLGWGLERGGESKLKIPFLLLDRQSDRTDRQRASPMRAP